MSAVFGLDERRMLKPYRPLMYSTRNNPSASRTRQWPSNMLKTTCSKPFVRDEDAVSAEETLVDVLGERDKALALLPYFTFHDIQRR